MSRSSEQGLLRSPTDWADLTEGSNVGNEVISRRADCSASIEGGFTNPALQKPTQHPQYPQRPQNPAYPQQLQQDQPSSQYSAPYQPGYGAYGPPPSYTSCQDDVSAKLQHGKYPPQEMQAFRQQPGYRAPTTNDPRSVAVIYPPPAPGQYVVTQPHVSGGQPPVFIARPILENPPSDYLGYSIFVTLCCCWIIGLRAIAKSRECRRAIEMGDLALAKEKSTSARDTAHASVVFGILAYIAVGVYFGVRVTLLSR